MELPITVDQDQLERFCQERAIRNLWLFGSALHDNLEPDSDLDLLVEYRQDARKSFFDLVDDRDAFQRLLRTDRAIDWVLIESLRAWLRDEVLEEARPLTGKAA